MDKQHVRHLSIGGRTSPIEQLPNELLVIILKLARTDSDGRPDQPKRLHWPILMRVCRYWRHTICNTPEFWQNIDVCHRMHWLILSLERSNMLPVHVNVENYRSGCGGMSFEETMEALTAHGSDRVLSLTYINLRSSETLQHTITPIPMPLLNRLTLHSSDSGGSWRLPVLNIPHAECFPLLQSLDLVDMGPRIVPDVLSRLRSLSLKYTDRYLEGPAYAERPTVFLAMLDACSSLESLTLIEVGSYAIGDGIEQGSGQLVTLRNIREVSIVDGTKYIASLLSHIHIPARAHVKLTESEMDYANLVLSAEQMLPSASFRDRLPILRSVNRLHFNIGIVSNVAVPHVLFRGFVDEGPSAGGSIEVTLNFKVDHHVASYYTEQGLTRLVPQWFPCDASLTSLLCVGDMHTMSSAKWEQTLRPYPNMQTLIVDEGNNLCGIGPLIEALRKERREGSANGGPLCPKLESLRIRNHAALQPHTQDVVRQGVVPFQIVSEASEAY